MIDEDRFAALVDSLAEAGDAAALTALLHEDHEIYDQRSTAAVVRMRGWVLLTLARIGLPRAALIFALEELDAGHDGYLVAAAARALRSSTPRPEFAPFVLRAAGSLRYRDEAVALDSYGAYADSSHTTTAMRELLATLAWLGPLGRSALPRLEELRAPGCGLSRQLLPELDGTVAAVGPVRAEAAAEDCCTGSLDLESVRRWPVGERVAADRVRHTRFEDHTGATVSFDDCFVGHPSIVAFFYTRCDNPQKCSLTVAKLARVQQRLAERGLLDRIATAAITYDPGFDLPARLRAYGQARQWRMDGGHRLLRATDGIESLRSYFTLGVNFVESLVNRHRIEIYVLDAAGRIAASFSRLHWDEEEVVDRAAELLGHSPGPATETPPSAGPPGARAAAPVLATLTSLGLALFPKCPICWATYMSALGISSLITIPYSPWWEPALLATLALNVASVWWRCRAIGRMAGAHLVSAGALSIVAAKLVPLPDQAALAGALLTLAGSGTSVWKRQERDSMRESTPSSSAVST